MRNFLVFSRIIQAEFIIFAFEFNFLMHGEFK